MCESPMYINGGAVVAMSGLECFAIGSDLRYGHCMRGANVTISTNKEKVYRLGSHSYIGLFGLMADTDVLLKRITFRKNLYELREKRAMNPRVLTNLISNILYEKRFGMYYVRPIIAGLDPTSWQPCLFNMDVIGCKMEAEDFVVAGTCSQQLYGACEALWTPSMDPDVLFETCSQALVNAFDRDASSGWGAVVHVVEKSQVTTRYVKTRMD